MMKRPTDIVRTCQDSHVFRPYLADRHDSIDSWSRWLTVLKIVYGLPCRESEAELVRELTGRDFSLLPDDGFQTVLLLTGRRSGKSRIAALIGAYEAVLAGHHRKLSKGETGVVAIVSPSLKQSRVVKDYLKSLFQLPIFAEAVIQSDKEGFQLAHNVRIEILAGDHTRVRGFTLLAAVVDEAAFLGVDDTAKIKSDTELVRALKPALATTGGKLIAITSPYARKGWVYQTWEKHFGKDGSKTLVVRAPSRSLNPNLPQSVIDTALADDYAGARSEFFAEWREDICLLVPEALVRKLIVSERFELPPQPKVRYAAHVDLSGGRVDPAALAIGHKADRKLVVDVLRNYPAPHNPYHVVQMMTHTLRQYGIRKVTGDNYAAEFVARAFETHGIGFEKSTLNRSALYLELLPRLCSDEVELLDHPLLVRQLTQLERRTRSGGRDVVDHPPNGHDDLSNVLAGVVAGAFHKRQFVGAF